MPTPPSLRTALFGLGALIALSAGGSNAARAGEPAITPGCLPGTTFDFHVEFTWPAGLAKPAGLTYGDFRCVIQDSAVVDAYSVGSAASAALQSAVGGANSTGPLTTAATAGLESMTVLPLQSGAAGEADFASARASVTLQGKVANPVMKCFGGLQPSPDWFMAVTVPTSDLCSLSVVPRTRRIGLHGLGTKAGSTFAASTTATSPVGTVQRVAAFPQVFGRLVIRRLFGYGECRKEGQYYSWRPTATWPSSEPRPAGANLTGFICVAHTTNFSLWKPRQLASPAMKSLAETGSTAAIEALLANNADVLFWRKFGDIAPGTTVVSEMTLPADMPNYPVYSCAGKVSPSPDWFVGIDSQPMCRYLSRRVLRRRFMLLTDAGTDDGASFTAADSPRTVPRPINLVTGRPRRAYAYFQESYNRPSSSAAAVHPASSRSPCSWCRLCRETRRRPFAQRPPEP